MKAATTNAAGTEVKDLVSLAALLDGNKAARFASLTYRSKESGELARHTILLNVNRARCLKVDLASLEAMRPSLTGLDAQACDELIASIRQTLETGHNDRYTKHGYYAKQGNGNVQLSVKAVAYVRGYSVAKVVLEKGTYKTVNSRPLTVAKDKLRKALKNTRCREFCITEDNFLLARHDGRTIVIDASGNGKVSALVGMPPVSLVETAPAPVSA